MITATTIVVNAQQKVIGECTVDFTVAGSKVAGITSTLYIKTNQARLDLNSPAFNQSTIFDKNGDVVILQDAGKTKFMRKLTKDKWETANKKYEGAKLVDGSGSKTILGYDCQEATLTLTDGTSYKLYYAKTIVPTFKGYEYQFKDVPGFVLEYESTDKSGAKITYTANRINMNPVPATQFDIPTSGYRVIE